MDAAGVIGPDFGKACRDVFEPTLDGDRTF